MIEKDVVLQFIDCFSEARDMFLHGGCYWFAEILHKRFRAPIYYNQIQNHFAVVIDGKAYDASGVISNSGFIPWKAYKRYDKYDYKRVVRDCVRIVE